MWPLIFGIKTYMPVYVLSMAAHAAIACWLCRRRGGSLRFGAVLGVAYVFGMVVGAKVLWDVLHGEVHWRRYFSVTLHGWRLVGRAAGVPDDCRAVCADESSRLARAT